MSFIGNAGITVTVKNAQTGEPLNVITEVSEASIVCRVGDDVYVVSKGKLSKDEALNLAGQITAVLSK